MPLTRKERQLAAEIEEIAAAVQMDHWNIEKRYQPKVRLVKLEAMKDQLVRSEVINAYNFIDEVLTDIICNFYFGRPKEKHYRRCGKRNRSKFSCIT